MPETVQNNANILGELQLYRDRLYGIAKDLKRLEDNKQELEQKAGLLRKLIDRSDETILLLDSDGRILEFNEKARIYTRKFFGREIRQGDSIYFFLNMGDISKFERNLCRALCGKLVEEEMSLSSDGRNGKFRIRFVPVRDDAGRILGVSFNIKESNGFTAN